MEILADGVWSWFGEPRAIYANGTTFVGAVSRNGHVMVASRVTAGGASADFTLHADLEADDHANPSLLELPSGKLMAFYTEHVGAQIYYRTTVSAHDITAWEAEQQFVSGTGHGYPHPVHLPDEGGANGRIHLFWRDGTGATRTSMRVTSDDLGATWSAAASIFQNAGERPYINLIRNGNGRIDFLATDGHPNEVANNSIYHYYYENGAFFQSDGTEIVAALPFGPGDVTKVYDSVATGLKAWGHDIAIDAMGNPIILFAAFVTTSDHRYRYARWTGTEWTHVEVAAAGGPLFAGEPFYTAGGAIYDPDTLYLCRQVSGEFEFWRYTSSDGGETWAGEALTSGGSTYPWMRPVVPVGATAAEPVVVLHGRYNTFVDYETAVVLWQSGA